PIPAENEFEPHGEYASKPFRSSRSTETILEAMATLLNNNHFATTLFLQYTHLHFAPTQGKETTTANEPCVAKFGPLPSKWQMASPEPSCVNKTADWRLKILQNGLYLIYGQVAPNTAYKGHAPFEVLLRRNGDTIQALTNSTTVQNIGGAYEFHAGDAIDLIFNEEHQVLKNNTYLGIFLLANPQFIS
ncbi:Tumor necrosis factor ligand superfamily member 18, partial [Camelus dromedarius]